MIRSKKGKSKSYKRFFIWVAIYILVSIPVAFVTNRLNLTTAFWIRIFVAGVMSFTAMYWIPEKKYFFNREK